MPVSLHLRPDETYGEEDMETFFEQILSHAPSITLVLLHLGGWGGYDESTAEAVDVVIAELKDNPVHRENIYFDLAAVATFEAEPQKRLLSQLREIGFDRILYGSDWTSPRSLHARQMFLRLVLLGITDTEWETMMSNQAPFLLQPPR